MGKDWSGNKSKQIPHNYEDLTGRVIGNFKVIHRITNKKLNRAMWLCECLSCGNNVSLSTTSLKFHKTKSCGCLTKSIISKTNSKHGLRKTRLYNIWSKIKSRCYNSNDKVYSYYGGRGIKVCESWINNFLSFYTWSIDH